MTEITTYQMVAESNRIEGIDRVPYQTETAEHERFMEVETITVEELETFVKVYQPNARLRDRRGLDVMVGRHVPPCGGPEIRSALEVLLRAANAGEVDPYAAHIEYENLHPFTDGNGRSGRMLWYWMMRFDPMVRLGFLHCFYYQTLSRADQKARALKAAGGGSPTAPPAAPAPPA